MSPTLPKITLFMAGLAILTGCNQNNPTTNNQDNKPILRIATEGAYAPFNYTNSDGSLGGFDVDIAHALCQKMAVDCQIEAQTWDGIIPALKTGKYDAIISAMSVTPERAQQISFSEPYFINSLVFLAKKDSTFNPANSDEINAAKIVAQGSTISSQWIQKAYPEAKVQLYGTLDNAFLDLSNDRADVMISDKLPALTWLKSELGQNFNIKGGDIDINDKFAIAVDDGNDELLDKFNQALSEIKADGSYDALMVKHFGEDILPSKTAQTPDDTQTATTDPSQNTPSAQESQK